MSKDYSLFRCWTTVWVLGDFGTVNVALPVDLPTADVGFILIGLFGFMDILIYGKWFKELDIQDKTIINQDVLFDKLSQDVEEVL